MVEGLTALVIDDEEAIGGLLVDILAMKNVSATFVPTTREGIALINEGIRYNFVFTDLYRHQPNGLEVYRLASSKGMDAHIMTGGPPGGEDPQLLSDAERETHDGVIMKPFRIADILGLVDQYITQQKP
ncbi:MAG: response regulator [Nanoarchaeota archaeon]